MVSRPLHPSRLFGAALCAISLSPTALAQDPVFDDFERHLLGPNWTLLGGPGAGIVAQSDLGLITAGGMAVAWTASSFAAEQLSEAEISLDIDPVMLTQVFVRLRDSDRARYGFHWNGDPGNSRWEIKYDGVPTAQTRILASLQSAGPLPGDRLRIEVSGTDPVVLRGYYNGVLKLTAIDGAPQRITASGIAGVVSRPRQGSTIVPPTPIFESWGGGSFAPSPTGASFCSGDGSGTACPCGNLGAIGRGCENSFATGGGLLAAIGTASVGADTLALIASGLPPTALTLFFQGDVQDAGGSGIVLGDGLRCASGSVIRLGSRNALDGTAAFGAGVSVDPLISVRGLVPAAGGARFYQGWYRNAAAFCTGETFNLTNGRSIAWAP